MLLNIAWSTNIFLDSKVLSKNIYGMRVSRITSEYLNGIKYFMLENKTKDKYKIVV